MTNDMKLIDASALMEYIHNHEYELVSRMGCVDKGMFTDGIEHGINIQPAVDATPVVHGQWIRRIVDHENPWYWKEECSICGFAGDADYRYCPHCGALMDGGAADD